jgi:catechol 2,3-dioxygenase-like lactoylglutathione lyase family enzyme
MTVNSRPAGAQALTFFHTGYVVRDLETGMTEIGAATGLTWRPPKVTKGLRVWTPGGVLVVDASRAYSVEGPPYLELVASDDRVWGPQAPAGEYHLGFWVDDLDQGADLLEKRGLRRVVCDFGDLGKPTRFAYYCTPSGLRVEILPVHRREEILG